MRSGASTDHAVLADGEALASPTRAASPAPAAGALVAGVEDRRAGGSVRRGPSDGFPPIPLRATRGRCSHAETPEAPEDGCPHHP